MKAPVKSTIIQKEVKTRKLRKTTNCPINFMICNFVIIKNVTKFANIRQTCNADAKMPKIEVELLNVRLYDSLFLRKWKRVQIFCICY